MGSYGSGRERTKYTVEECLCLDISYLVREGVIKPNTGTKGTLGAINFETQCETDHGHMLLYYTVKSLVSYWVHLVTTRPHFGGLRWWWKCPTNGCGRRVRILYLAPGTQYFRCSTCHDLTYQSSRDSHKYDTVFTLLAKKIGITPEIVKYALERRRLSDFPGRQ